ncbi:hypothetical protein TIFTF001_009939 [Ficus carica]|uniref:Uncharacterized protein n=1 Tax=Ficus carica TaxID=3494 RepID=A0AA88D413_FICCA|nr:hypothetical protein TIFTF001_009939 [Ficus carica]
MSATHLAGDKLLVELEIIDVDKKEARAVEAEARVHGAAEPVAGVDDPRDAEWEDEEEECTGEEKTGGGGIRGLRAEEEEVEAGDDSEDVEDEEDEGVAADAVGREGVEGGLAEDRGEGGDGGEEGNESVEDEVKGWG